jgi:hypothetical protein
MGRFSRPSDEADGGVPAGNALSADDAELVGLVRDLHLTFASNASEETVARHLAAIVETARLLDEGTVAVAGRIAQGSSRGRERPSRPSSRRTPMRRIALMNAVLLLLAVVGGAAASGVVS